MKPAVTAVAEEAEKISVKSRYRCKVCGITDINKFYPSVKNLCKIHHSARTQEHRRSHPGNIHLSPDPSQQLEAAPTSDTVPVPALHTCKVCGHEFEAYQHGVVTMTRMCRECITAKVSNATRNRPAKIPSHVPNIVLYFEDGDEAILSRISAEAKRNRRTLANQVLFVLQEALDA